MGNKRGLLDVMPFYAHSGLKDDYSDWQPLHSHLRGVAELAARLAGEMQPICPGDTPEIRQWKEAFHRTAWYAGLLHDFGKYREQFQQYLRKERGRSAETAHAVYGAATSWHRLNDLASAFAVAGHHMGLHDMSDLDNWVNGSKFNAKQRLAELLQLAEDERELGTLPEFQAMPVDDTDEKEKRHYELMTRMLFSLVVDADRLDSERWGMEQKLGRPWERQMVLLETDILSRQLCAARDKKSRDRPADELNKLRSQVFETCLEKGSALPQGFFSLTVPTGGGKTLSSMAFALSHAKQHKLRRVIVVIPYLSIIEQNAKEYRDTFGIEQVLEHHSAVESPKAQRPAGSGGADEPAETTDMEKVLENWDAPIIVTTSVQFLETLFAASPGRARKLHNISRSVVIFDEVQTLPTHLLEPTLDVLRELKNRYGASFLFCSATQPAFRKSANLKHGFEPDEVTEIAPDPPDAYRKLRGVDYHIESKDNPWDWRTLAERMASQPQALCVLNLRRQAFELWKAMSALLQEQGHEKEPELSLFHLSSAMCPAHRLDLLGLSKNPPQNNIKSRLEKSQPCWVISTQLIEAGVDIDFPIVLRALGPLDSIVQAGGRCNRERRLKDESGNPCHGKVIVFYPQDAGLPPGIYERATNISPAYLDPERLATDPLIFTEYFNELYQISRTDHSRKGEHTIQHDRAEFYFQRVSQHARVIKDNTIAVIVPYGSAATMVKEIRKTGHFDRGSVRALQRYMVNVRNEGPFSDFAKLQSVGAVEPLLPERLEIPVLEKWCYKIEPPLGVVIENRPLEDFIQ